MHVPRTGNSSGDELLAPSDYRTGCPGNVMPEVSWTSDTCVGGVSELVGLFRTTFVFKINSSGYFSSTGQTVRRAGRFNVRYVSGVRWAYGYRICIRWSVLSNFGIQSFSIRATVIGTGIIAKRTGGRGVSVFGALGGVVDERIPYYY